MCIRDRDHPCAPRHPHERNDADALPYVGRYGRALGGRAAPLARPDARRVIRVACRAVRQREHVAESVAHGELMPALRALRRRHERLGATDIATYRAHWSTLLRALDCSTAFSDLTGGAASTCMTLSSPTSAIRIHFSSCAAQR